MSTITNSTDDEWVIVDTSVLINYLYSNVVPENLPDDIRENIGKFEDEKDGCKEVFNENTFTVFSGGKVIEELNNLCERRERLYEDIEAFLAKTDKSIFDYEPGFEMEEPSDRDKRHIREQIQMNMVEYESNSKQLEVIRRVIDQVIFSKNDLLIDELDHSTKRFYDDELKEEISDLLNIGHDVDVLVDAVYISKQLDANILISIDSDINSDYTEEKLHEAIDKQLQSNVDIQTCHPKELLVKV